MTESVAVVGLGKSGLSTVNFLLAHGVIPVVFDTREKPAGENELDKRVTLCKGELDGDKLGQFDCLVVGPGLSLKLPALV